MVHASQLLSWIVLLPLIGAALNGFLGWNFSRRRVHIIGVGSIALTFALALRAFFALRSIAAQNAYDPSISDAVYTWAASGIFHFEVAFYLDPLSSVMLLVVTGVGLLIHIFSMGYMADDKSYARYFAYLNLFMFSMLVLILGKNLLMLFVGWEGVGLCSYLLIGFWFSDDQKAQAEQKAFIVNRIGDFAFIIGIMLLLYHCSGTTDFEVMQWHCASGGYGPFQDPYTLLFCCILLLVGACGKSAQVPLYVWLPDAMAGPTPVSALIHAATMVTAGIYMIARMGFLYTLSPPSMAVVATIGATTALFAAIIALRQNDIKKVLAYSTVSQLGYMMLAVGVGAYVAGIFHLMTHAFFKALLFLGSGSVIHAMSGEQNIFKMGGLKRKMPITRNTFLIATMAIAGVPLLAGFFSKDEILWETLTRGHMLPLPAQLSAAGTTGGEGSLVLGGEHGITMSTDTGDNWTQSRVPMTALQAGNSTVMRWPNLTAATATPDGTVWLTSGHGVIYRGDGENWELAHSPDKASEAKALTAAWAAGDSDVWFVGRLGRVVHYTAGGFTDTTVGTQVGLHALIGRSTSEIYAGGDRGIIYRYDGKTWTQQPSLGSGRITAFADTDDGLYAVSSQGGLYHQVTGEWLEIPMKVDGLQAVLSATSIVVKGNTIHVGASARKGGQQVAVLLSREDGVWRYESAGAGNAITRVMAHGESVLAIGTTGNGRNGRLWRTGDGGLQEESRVPYKPWYHLVFYVVALGAAVLTAFYMFRLYFLTFEGETRADAATWSHVHESPPSMTIPLIVLAFLSIFGGYIGTPLFEHVPVLDGLTNKLHHWLEPSFRVADGRLHGVHDLGAAWGYAGLSVAVAGLGIVLAYLFYLGGLKDMPGKLSERFAVVDRVISNKFYVDELYDVVFVRGFRAIARVLHQVFDVLIIDGLGVRGSALLLAGIGKAVRVAQNGNVQQYLVAVIAGLAALAWYLGG